MYICVADSKIRPQKWNEDLSPLSVREHLLGSSVEPFHFGQEFRFGQIVHARIPFRQMRAPSTGDKQLLWFQPVLPAQATREFEANDASHTVTKECEGQVQVREDVTREAFDNWFQPRACRLPQSVLASR